MHLKPNLSAGIYSLPLFFTTFFALSKVSRTELKTSFYPGLTWRKYVLFSTVLDDVQLLQLDLNQILRKLSRRRLSTMYTHRRRLKVYAEAIHSQISRVFSTIGIIHTETATPANPLSNRPSRALSSRLTRNLNAHPHTIRNNDFSFRPFSVPTKEFCIHSTACPPNPSIKPEKKISGAKFLLADPFLKLS